MLLWYKRCRFKTLSLMGHTKTPAHFYCWNRLYLRKWPHMDISTFWRPRIYPDKMITAKQLVKVYAAHLPVNLPPKRVERPTRHCCFRPHGIHFRCTMQHLRMSATWLALFLLSGPLSSTVSAVNSVCCRNHAKLYFSWIHYAGFVTFSLFMYTPPTKMKNWMQECK